MAKTDKKITADTFKEYGRKGGKATLEKHGKAHFSKLAKRMHRKRKQEGAK